MSEGPFFFLAGSEFDQAYVHTSPVFGWAPLLQEETTFYLSPVLVLVEVLKHLCSDDLQYQGSFRQKRGMDILER